MIVISLGSNVAGRWGHPKDTFRRAIRELAACGIQSIGISKIYLSEAHAYFPQPSFFNATIIVKTTLPPAALLQVLKIIEAEAGRSKPRSGGLPYFRWMPRPLDLDIVCYNTVVCNWWGFRPQAHARVTLPHPRAHERAFVLRPLSEAAPFWHHPVFGKTAGQLLKRPKVRDTGKILGSEDFPI